MNNETAEQRLARTFYVVEANSFERLTLWQQHASNMRPPGYIQLHWDQVSDGRMPTIGRLDKRPLCLDISWARIEGYLVAFYDECSQLRDSVRTEKWLEKHFKTWRNFHCDAMNFGHCLSAIEDAKQLEANSAKIITNKA